MRTIAQKTEIQRALKIFSEAVGGNASRCVILVKGVYIQSSICFLQKVSAGHMKVNICHNEQSSP